jgi:signal transduction histidine kinase
MLTCSGFSGFNVSGLGDWLLDFKRFAMATKISSTYFNKKIQKIVLYASHPHLMRLLQILIFCLLTTASRSQTVDSSIIRLSRVHFFDSIEKKCFRVAEPIGAVPDKDIPLIRFPDKATTRRTVPDSLMEKDCFLKFTVYNDTDSSGRFFFNPGYSIRNAAIYGASTLDITGTFRRLPDEELPAKAMSGSKLISLGKGETMVYFVKFRFIRSNTNSYQPRLIEQNFYASWLRMINSRDAYLNMFILLASGILVMMMFYSLAVYIQNRQSEFLFYSAYVFCSVTVLFLKVILPPEQSGFFIFFEEYLDFVIICVGVHSYLFFIRRFLNTGAKDPFLEKTMKYAENALVLLLVTFSAIYFGTSEFVMLNLLENYVIKVLIFFISFIVIIYSFRKHDTLLRYVAAGNIALVIFMMISLGIIVFKWTFVKGNPGSILNRSLLYYALGLVLEMMFFLAGLAYKNKNDITEQVKERERFKLENERREFEKQVAVLAVRQEERDRISADMHDDLGSGVTAIRLMSEIVKSKMNTDQYPEIDKISNSANELLGKMNSIIWTMKSSNDTLESLVAYLRAYATEYFDATPVVCHVDVAAMTEMEMSGEKRRNIFLSFKETLNNILKHAQASEVEISMATQDGNLIILIRDNGIGIDTQHIRRFGNGLNNIRKRMQAMNGELLIANDHGTVVRFQITLV